MMAVHSIAALLALFQALLSNIYAKTFSNFIQDGFEKLIYVFSWIGKEACERARGEKHFLPYGSSGIGKAIAVRFAAEGANIAINYRSHPEAAASVVWAATLPDDRPRGGFFRDGKSLPW